MSNPDDTRASPDEQLVTNALLKLRMHEGLTAARLNRDERNAAALLALPSIEGLTDEADRTPADAAVELVRRGVLAITDPTWRIVADTALALGIYSDAYANSDLPERTVADLTSDSLGRRRDALRAHWQRIHTSLGLQSGAPPADRTLRNSVEFRALEELARILVGTQSAARLIASPTGTDGASRPITGKVIVIGAAVMDAIFRAKRIPHLETSEFAHDFILAPGGKGLTQAMAAARLGLHVSLVAAIADDQFGEEIRTTLTDANVDTSLLKHVTDARTPFTGVFEKNQGDSAAMIWRNEPEMSLDVRDLIERIDQLMACDALLLTFEVPRETIQQALVQAHTDPTDRPTIIVTPGQPYPDEGLPRSSLRLIDFMVAHQWELEQYEPANLRRFNPEVVGKHLLARGVETLCFLGNGGGSIYSETDVGTYQLPTLASLYKESSLARDVFCAALAASLIDHNRIFSKEVARWATAAMASAAEAFSEDGSPLPDRARVEQRLKTLPAWIQA